LPKISDDPPTSRPPWWPCRATTANTSLPHAVTPLPGTPPTLNTGRAPAVSSESIFPAKLETEGDDAIVKTHLGLIIVAGQGWSPRFGCKVKNLASCG